MKKEKRAIVLRIDEECEKVLVEMAAHKKCPVSTLIRMIAFEKAMEWKESTKK